MPSDLAAKVTLPPEVVDKLARRIFKETSKPYRAKYPGGALTWKDQGEITKDMWRFVAVWHMQQLVDAPQALECGDSAPLSLSVRDLVHQFGADILTIEQERDLEARILRLLSPQHSALRQPFHVEHRPMISATPPSNPI